MKSTKLPFIDFSSLVAVTAAGLMLYVWELLAQSNSDVNFFVSRPSHICLALLEMGRSGELLRDFAVTASEALLGTTAGTILGSAVGLALWMSKRASRIASPFVVAAGNFPVFALAPAAIVWLGVGIGMKVFLAAFATFFVSLSLSYQGARLAHQKFNGVFDGFGASAWDRYHKVIVPEALDAVFGSMRVNVGLGILGAFIGEFIASESGLGRAIMRASGLYQIDRVFAASLCIIALAVLFDRLAIGIQQEKLFIARIVGIPRVLRRRSRRLHERFRGI